MNATPRRFGIQLTYTILDPTTGIETCGQCGQVVVDKLARCVCGACFVGDLSSGSPTSKGQV